MTGEEKPGMGAAETGTAGIGAVGIRAAGAGIRAQLRSEVMEEIQDRRHMEDEELFAAIDRAIGQKGQQIYLPLKERLWLRNSLYDSFRRLDILQELLDDEHVTEIMVNGAGKIFIERDGTAELWTGALKSQSSWRTLSSRL